MRVAWVPFELHPEAPVEGIPREVYFGRARSEQMAGHLQSVAAEVGLTMESRDVIINSRRALGAAEFAREKGKFDEMHHALFKAHWERTARLEDVDDLVEIGDLKRQSLHGGAGIGRAPRDQHDLMVVILVRGQEHDLAAAAGGTAVGDDKAENARIEIDHIADVARVDAGMRQLRTDR